MSSQPPAQERARHQVSSLSSLSSIRARCALALIHLAGYGLALLCLVGCALAILCLRALASGGPNSLKTASTRAALSPPSSPARPGSSILTSSKGPFTAERHMPRTGKKLTSLRHRLRQVISIDMLPDDILLAIFDFCLDENDPYYKKEIEAWQPLAQVCRRWRSVVYGSPNRLNLRLVCTAKTPARHTLDVWPAFPLLIQGRFHPEEALDNIISVLERSDRVCVIDLEDVSSSQLEKLSAAMQVPFPELTRLELSSYGEVVLPNSFLGGSTPRLQFLHLFGIPFPGLPTLLLSATHLVNLYLWSIPHSGYISPDALLTSLFTLTSLGELILEFQSPRSRPDDGETRRPPPLTRSVLSVLTYFRFKGDSEYFDNLVAHIDAPRLNNLYIIFFNQIVFYTPQFIQFIRRTPRLKAPEKAHVTFETNATRVQLSSLTSGYGEFHVNIPCRELDWQVSCLEQICTSCLPPLSALENLYIHESTSSRAHWQEKPIENLNALWLELLHPFSAVKNLYLSEELSLRIVPALKELVAERAAEVLPALQNIFLERLQSSRPVQEGIRQFIAARQVDSRLIAVNRWDTGYGRTKFQ